MGQEAGDITAKLDSAISEEVESTESPTVETESRESEASTSTEGKKSAVKSVPYTRFKEVNDAKKSIEDNYASLQSKYEEQTTTLTKLTQMLEAIKEDADMVKDIRAMAQDPKMFPHIEAIDKRLKGIEADIEETGEVDDKKVDKVQKVLAKEQEKLQEQLEDHRLEILTTRADAIAEKWLAALPEQYTAEDKEIISELWVNKVDFDDLKANPASLSDVLRNTFQETINKYGRPRGGLIDPADPETYEIVEEEQPTPTPEEELAAIVKGRNLGGFKTVDKGGKKVSQPEVSDEEFTEILAKQLRQARR